MVVSLKGIELIKCRIRAETQDAAIAKAKEQFPGAKTYLCAGQHRHGMYLIEVIP